jgi:hypothetical protein
MVSLSMTLSEDVPMDASFWCNKAAVFSDKGHSIHLKFIFENDKCEAFQHMH